MIEFVRASRTVSAIADYIGLSRPAANQMISKLAGRRLLRRLRKCRSAGKSGPVDRQRKKLLDRIAAARAARFRASLAVLPERAAHQLMTALAETVEAFEKASRKGLSPPGSGSDRQRRNS